ncbi:hypothetical protein E2562_025361 [Oryza meyeriana var. granulata]|uniref:Uncharacterized protein n=1 Tax=Oryza meyeriana var. granulata TaxID=110450 RepID=A0A6G1DND0_9ORYZ|nr:hypothetical protein E2562_025361 [Oryza meyeriana var. granulata]
MAKGGLSKLKCMIKRWHSSSRISRTPSGCSAGSTSARSHGGGRVGGEEWGRSVVAVGGGGGVGVGAGGSVSFHGVDGNADPQPESLDELVEYYAC